MIEDLIHQIPAHIHLTVALTFVAGVVLWGIGSRLVRPMMVLAGLVVGIAAGFVASGFISEEIPAIVPVAAAAAFFMIVALVAYRFAMSWLLALCLALVCPLSFYTYTEITGHYAGQPGEPISSEELLLPLSGEETEQDPAAFDTEDLRKASEKAREVIDDFLKGQSEGEGEGDGDDASTGEEDGNSTGDEQVSDDGDDEKSQKTREIIESWRKKLRDTLGEVGTVVEDRWQDAPAAQKWGVIVTAGAGLLAGFLAGMLMPSASAAIVTAFAGALVMLVSGFWLATRIDLPVDAIRPASATASLAYWLSLSFVGLMIQMIGGRRQKKKSATSRREPESD